MNSIKIKKEDAGNLWFSADWHISHQNICRGISQWEPKVKNYKSQEEYNTAYEKFEIATRDFKDLNSMNQTIVNNMNALVKPNDTLVLLGDTMFGAKEYASFFPNINCKNIYVLAGNHCNRNKIERDSGANYTYVGDYFKVYVGNSREIICSHYPIMSWENMSRESIHLYAHTHSNIARSTKPAALWFNNMKTLDVGIDNAFRMYEKYHPFNYVIDIVPHMEQRSNRDTLDHH